MGMGGEQERGSLGWREKRVDGWTRAGLGKHILAAEH